MKRSQRVPRVQVSADGTGVVSHAGVGRHVSGPWLHAPGRVFTDLAVAVADGADAISGIAVLGDREDLHGPVASMPTTWRVLDRVDADHLPLVREAKAAAVLRRGRRAPARTWTARSSGNCVWTSTPRSRSRTARRRTPATTWKRTFGSTRCFLNSPDVAGGEALCAGLLRAGNAGSNTAIDHITVLDMALSVLPGHARPVFDPDTQTWTGQRLLARSNSAGATHAFAKACVERGVEFSFRYPYMHGSNASSTSFPNSAGTPRSRPTASFREGAWVAEATGMMTSPRGQKARG